MSQNHYTVIVWPSLILVGMVMLSIVGATFLMVTSTVWVVIAPIGSKDDILA